MFHFLLFGRGACFMFRCLGGGHVSFLAVRARGMFSCLLFGPDGRSLTYRPAWPGFKGPINKKDQTAKKTRVPQKPHTTPTGLLD